MLHALLSHSGGAHGRISSLDTFAAQAELALRKMVVVTMWCVVRPSATNPALLFSSTSRVPKRVGRASDLSHNSRSPPSGIATNA
jgi:hypothetical protein